MAAREKMKGRKLDKMEERDSEERMDGDGEKRASVVIFHHNPVTVE